MPDQRIDQLNAETTPAAVDVLPVFSISGSDTKKITVKNLVQVGAGLVDDASIPLAKVNLGALNIVNASIDASAAISYSKLATLTSGNIVLGSSANVATSTAVTGDVTISNTGVTAIATGVIVNADVNANAAIVDTKLATISTAGKVSNSATTAASTNTASAIVARDASGNFTAGTITAALTGTASGNLVAGGALGTPSSGTLTSCIGLPISTGVSGLGTGAATFLATPSSANFAALLTGETGSGAAVFATSPTLVSPALGTPVSGVLTNCTNLPVATASVVGAVSIPAAGGFALTGGGALSHSNSVAGGASTRSGITYDLQGHIVSTVAIVASDLPAATTAAKGAVIAGTGLAVDGNGILSTAVATTNDLGGIKIGSEFDLNGSNQLLLAVQANVAGGTAYQKVTVNSKGVVTAGATLDATDIPNLAASKITSGTLAIDRYGANTITGAKLANYATGKISEAFPTADYISQLYFNPLDRTLYMWDGNVFQPIGVSYGQVVFSGTYDAGTNLITSVTTEGAAIGLTVGGALVSPITANKSHYVVVDQPGTGTAPAPSVALSPPDMLLSNGTTWVLLDVSDTVTAQLASNIQVSPAGNIASTNVQSALQELDDEKLPLAGGTLTGNLALNTGIAIVYEGSTTDNFETTLFVVDPTADRTILLPNVSGTVVTTGDTGTVTSTMLLDGTILNEDINASAGIVDTKLATIATAGKVSNSATTAASANTASAIVARDASGNFTAGTITAALTGNAATVTTNANLTGDVTSTGNATAIAAGVIVNADINASAAIAGTKIAPDFGAQTITTTGVISPALGTAALPSVAFTGDLNTGIFSPGADQVAISTNGVGRLFVNATGNVGIGTTNPATTLDVVGGYFTGGNSRTNNDTKTFGLLLPHVSSATNPVNIIGALSTTGQNLVYIGGSDSNLTGTSATTIHFYTAANGTTANGTERARIRSDGMFEVKGAGTAGSSPAFSVNGSAPANSAIIDTSGRLLVGTSTARSNFFNTTITPGVQFESASDPRLSIVSNSSTNEFPSQLILAHQQSGATGGNTAVNSASAIGLISFQGSDGTDFVEAARIIVEVDGTPGANDMPGRLVFSTTADGASSPTERVRITQQGELFVGVQNPTTNSYVFAKTISNTVGIFDRTGSDGTLITLRHDGTDEGTISVSGTTVSYNGAHLSRWSQLASGAERTEILRGSVLSNLDEMCEWGEEDNEQLNRMRVSNIEGDKNVSGVFQSWDDDDDTYTNDFYCAMTGDFIIRIAEGVTVERGDLLMSAGDGTAKPQDDDIIRSKTVAKVTSTNVSCTYEDGSYCVPCVLMAC